MQAINGKSIAYYGKIVSGCLLMLVITFASLVPGATSVEQMLTVIPAAIFAGFVVIHASVVRCRWDLWQYIIAALLAFDIAGGVVANATSCAQRWYHRTGQGFREHLGFVSIEQHYVAPASVENAITNDKEGCRE